MERSIKTIASELTKIRKQLEKTDKITSSKTKNPFSRSVTKPIKPPNIEMKIDPPSVPNSLEKVIDELEEKGLHAKRAVENMFR